MKTWAKHSSADEEDAWECRFITTELPPRFLPGRLSSAWKSDGRGEIHESDVYLLAAAPEVNIKIRRRTNTLKVKTMQERRPDGLERWRTEIDVRLPAGWNAWRRALQFLSYDGDAKPLANADHPDEALKILQKGLSTGRMVVVEKKRSKFRQVGSVLEIACVALSGRVLRSVALEATDPRMLHAALRSLETSDLGPPRSYTELLAEAGQAST